MLPQKLIKYPDPVLSPLEFKLDAIVHLFYRSSFTDQVLHRGRRKRTSGSAFNWVPESVGVAEPRVGTLEPRGQPPRPPDPPRLLHLLLHQLHAPAAGFGSHWGWIFADRFLNFSSFFPKKSCRNKIRSLILKRIFSFLKLYFRAI